MFQPPIVLVDVVTEPVTVAEVKAWSRIDANYSSDDTNLSLMISAAREKLEGELNVYFAVKTIEVWFDGLYIKLPYGPTGDILTIYNNGDDPYADIEYTLHGSPFKALCIGTESNPVWFYRIGSSPVLWEWSDYIWPVPTYTVTYETGYVTLPKLLKEALLIQIDYDIKNQGSGDMAALSPLAIQKARRLSQNLPL